MLSRAPYLSAVCRHFFQFSALQSGTSKRPTLDHSSGRVSSRSHSLFGIRHKGARGHACHVTANVDIGSGI